LKKRKEKQKCLLSCKGKLLMTGDDKNLDLTTNLTVVILLFYLFNTTAFSIFEWYTPLASPHRYSLFPSHIDVT